MIVHIVVAFLMVAFEFVIQSTAETFIFPNGTFANETIDCSDSESCAIYCIGARSCQGTTINCPINGDCNIFCNRSETCQGASINCPVGTSNSFNGLTYNCNLECENMDGSNEAIPCQKLQFNANYSNNANVACVGYYACYEATFYNQHATLINMNETTNDNNYTMIINTTAKYGTDTYGLIYAKIYGSQLSDDNGNHNQASSNMFIQSNMIRGLYNTYIYGYYSNNIVIDCGTSSYYGKSNAVTACESVTIDASNILGNLIIYSDVAQMISSSIYCPTITTSNNNNNSNNNCQFIGASPTSESTLNSYVNHANTWYNVYGIDGISIECDGSVFIKNDIYYYNCFSGTNIYCNTSYSQSCIYSIDENNNEYCYIDGITINGTEATCLSLDTTITTTTTTKMPNTTLGVPSSSSSSSSTYLNWENDNITIDSDIDWNINASFTTTATTTTETANTTMTFTNESISDSWAISYNATIDYNINDTHWDADVNESSTTITTATTTTTTTTMITMPTTTSSSSTTATRTAIIGEATRWSTHTIVDRTDSVSSTQGRNNPSNDGDSSSTDNNTDVLIIIAVLVGCAFIFVSFVIFRRFLWKRENEKEIAKQKSLRYEQNKKDVADLRQSSYGDGNGDGDVNVCVITLSEDGQTQATYRRQKSVEKLIKQIEMNKKIKKNENVTAGGGGGAGSSSIAMPGATEDDDDNDDGDGEESVDLRNRVESAISQKEGIVRIAYHDKQNDISLDNINDDIDDDNDDNNDVVVYNAQMVSNDSYKSVVNRNSSSNYSSKNNNRNDRNDRNRNSSTVPQMLENESNNTLDARNSEIDLDVLEKGGFIYAIVETGTTEG